MKRIFLSCFVFWFLFLGMPAFATGIQIDFLLAGLRNPLTDAFLANGLVYTYAAGTTASKSLYMDAALASASTNPVVLDAYGRAVRYGSGKYKFVIKTSAGGLLWTLDNLEYSSCATLASQTTNPFGATMKVTNFTTPNLTATLAADLNANGYAIHNVATATLPYDLVTLGYVDEKVASLTSDIASEVASLTVEDAAIYAALATVSANVTAQISSITPAIPSFTVLLADGYDQYAILDGSGTWNTPKTFAYQNTSGVTEYIIVYVSGQVSMGYSSSTAGLEVACNFALMDTSGAVYDRAYSRLTAAEVTIGNLDVPINLLGVVEVPAGVTKTFGIYYKNLTVTPGGSGGYLYLGSSNSWYKIIKVK